MSRGRWVAVVLILLGLAGLFAWQTHRERLVANCIAKGGYWNGPRSACQPTPIGPILRRALQRT
jgi:hypothetical protein